MRPTQLLAVLIKEFRALGRDLHGIAVLFVMPAAFILVMSLALRDVFTAGESKTLYLVAVQLDRSPQADELVAALPKNTARAATREEAETRLREGQSEIAVIVPAGYGAGVAAGGDKALAVEILAEPTVRPEIMRVAKGQVEAAVIRQRILARISAMTGGFGPGARELAAIEGPTPVVANYLPTVGGKVLTATQQNVPAWLVFGMFFVVTPICNLLVAERTFGTLARLRTMHVPMATLLIGKLLPFYLINMVQLGLMLLVGRYLVPLLGGDPLDPSVPLGPLLIIASATSVAALGTSILVAALARTSEQAATFGNLLNVLFGAIGGIMVPKMVMPAFMQTAAQISPMYWALEGFLEVFLRTGRLDVVSRYALVLVAIGLACGSVASYLIVRRR